jgi:hypothetical protein
VSEDVLGRQASTGGPWSRAFLRACAVLLWLAVAFPLVFAAELPWWATVLATAVVAAAMVPLGLLLWSDADERKADTRRLRRACRPAVAEITDVEHVDSGDDTGTVVVLRLRISGDGVPPFAATYRGRPDDEYRVGGLLCATVDPADNLFTLQPLRRGARA